MSFLLRGFPAQTGRIVFDHRAAKIWPVGTEQVLGFWMHFVF
jgi:hypothetical protein